MRYQIEVDFDDENGHGDPEVYFEAQKKYDAFCIGHSKTGTSTMFISAGKLDLGKLAEELKTGNIKILSVRRAA